MRSLASCRGRRRGVDGRPISYRIECPASRAGCSAALERLGVKQRFGAIGKKGSIALIERLWRTLKDTLGLRLMRPIAEEDLMAKIELRLLHYADFRPHQALGGATPVEVYFGRMPEHLSAIPPPRGRPGEGLMDLPFLIDYLDGERRLPVLVRKAA